MGDAKKMKKKCCHKFEKKGNHCSRCSLPVEDEGEKLKKEKTSGREKTKKKEKKREGKKKE
ncbi:MAG: hypothetical protein KKB91_04870 [Proteobacteria bacterium]|jgi:hypothetical protein|nr:hypothetical protein [Desulfocapsa sp.]MBU3943537.1 hypothetical protein [Pseudomonadota bacterium]MCG2743425.1 hypothetical protein [Desulfobacteraceae bacterium]MDO8947307.1 hypothetical protein [Desulfocapsaceae bacterium]MBU3983355.1 hypothetical protein [Pseudomonadota bacterium]